MLTEELKKVLSSEQAEIMSAKIGTMIDEKAEEKAQAIIEEEKAELKAELSASADAYVKEKVQEITAEKQAEFDSLLEESKQEFATSLDTKVAELESKMVGHMDTLLEEEVDIVLTKNQREDLAKMKAYAPIIDGTIKLFEEHLVPIEPEAIGQIETLRNDNVQLEESLDSETESRVVLTQENDKLKALLLVEHKCSDAGLTDTQHDKVSDFFTGSSFAEVKERIDTTIELLEENRELSNDNTYSESINNDSDIDPDANLGDGNSQMIEEQLGFNSEDKDTELSVIEEQKKDNDMFDSLLGM